jgi:hypothetical protein
MFALPAPTRGQALLHFGRIKCFLICSKATVRAIKQLTVLVLDRTTFVSVLGPLQDIMAKEKSPEVSMLASALAMCV